MRRTRVFVAVALCMAGLATPAWAEDRMPTDLWSEYPLVQEVQRVQSTTIGPLLPPTTADDAAPPGGTTPWSLWLALSAVAAAALLLAVRRAAPLAASVARPRARPRRSKPMQLRGPTSRPRAPARRRRAQYAPLPPVAVAEPDIEREPRRYVTRRSGFLRSRFVVAADEPGGKVTRLGGSRSFWRVGNSARREHAAEDAWNDLMNDLRAKGWEPSSAQPSDFYILLRPVETEPSSILPTIEAYTHRGTSANGS